MLKKSSKSDKREENQNSVGSEYVKEQVLTKSLEKNIGLFNNIFYGDETLITRRFQNKHLSAAKCCIVYLNGMVNTEVVNENIIQPVLCSNLAEEIECDNLLEELQYKVIVSDNIKMLSDVNEAVSSIINGDTALLLEGYENILIISSKGFKTRNISEPESGKVVRGPREGFTEALSINLTLLRRKIKNPNLRLKFMEIGEKTRTKICICYIEGLALDNILKELEKRLNDIKIDGILDSGYIQELIRDAPFSPFETVGYTERPDVIAGKLLEGRIALLVDGSPFVLTVPFVFIENIQSNEDYYNNFIFASVNRIIRATGTIISVSVPALYVAVVNYHQEMLPTPLLMSISAARQGVPFPTALSILLMLLVFDILREAGTRMPTPIGQAVNIVGSLVLGQAVVEAKLVSAPVVIITALSGITTLLNISMIGASIIIRTLLLLGSSVLGVYGFSFVLILVIIHLMNIRSFGIPYMLNLSSAKNHNFQDTWIRAPWWSMTLRPKIIAAKNLVRQLPDKGSDNQQL